MKNLKYIFILLLLGLVSCADLEVENPNDPDTDRVLGTPQDLLNIVKSGANTWYNNVHDFGWRMTVSVMADAHTCSWGNAGMRDMSNEPRKQWDNSVQYGNAYVTEEQYNESYAVINQVNRVLQALAEGKGDALGDDKDRIKAFGHFLLGLNFGYLGLTFNQAVITRPGEEVSAETFDFSPYDEVISYAVENLDQAISTAASASSASYDGWFNGVTLDREFFIELCHTYAAKFLMLSARTQAQTDAVDWNKVLAYAQNGLTEDFTVMNDGDQWIAWGQAYSNRPGWVRTDLRVISLMDPDYPNHFSDDQTSLDPATSADARLESDWEYNSTVPFRANRGLYHYSNYRYSRLDPLPTDLEGPAPDTYQAENELIMAEALARLGQISEALEILNVGTRVTRGGLDPLTSTDAEEVLDAIFYEREIELFSSAAGLPWYDMRRRDLLQKGTLLHFPVPGRELETLQRSSYSFGGEANADGVNTSNGGWR